MWLSDALYRNEKLNIICNHHEQASVMAADINARLYGCLGAALVTIGPGATNAITGVAQAYTDSSAVFVVSGQASTKLLNYEKETKIRQHGTQSLVLDQMIPPITKYFAVIDSPSKIRYHMERAYHEATTGRKGPVWLDVPIDIQNKDIPESMEGYTPPVEDNEILDLSLLKEKFESATKPLILAGGGASQESILSIAQSLRIPVVTSRMGIGCIPSDHELYVGRPGSYGQRAAHFAIQQADLLLVLGSRLSVATIGYYPDRFAGNAYKIQIDLDEKELAKTDVPVDYKCRTSVANFVDAVKNLQPLQSKEWIEHCQTMRNKYPVVLPEYKDSNPLNSYYFTKILSELAAENAVITVDTGSVCNVVSQTWHLKSKQNYFISGGFSCMGFWAGSIGTVNKSVIALAGDGSTSMNIQEFATIAHYQLPIKLFIYKNNGYMLIRHNQHNYLDDRFIGVHPESGTEMPDFCRIAEAYQLPTAKIQYGDNLEEKIQEILDSKGPVVCEVILEEFGPLAPRISSRVLEDGSLKAAEFDDLAPFLEEGGD